VADYQLPASLAENIKNKFSAVEMHEHYMLVPPEDLILVMTELRNNPQTAFNFLTNLTGAQYQDFFEVVYNLVSMTHGHTLTVKVRTAGDNPKIPSVYFLWAGANWQEREVYDLMGIVFTGYPDHPTRILLDDDFEGHPLRKDYRWQGGRED